MEGIFERVSATALHIGFTLLLAYRPVLLLITLPLHSLINMGALNLTKRFFLATQMLIALVGIATLVVGIKLFL